MNAIFEPGDRVMISTHHLRILGTEQFGAGSEGPSRYCKGRGTFIGHSPRLTAIGYVLWDDDEINGVARGINVGNLVHVRDVAREADHAQHSPGRPFQASTPTDKLMRMDEAPRELQGAFA